jgi:hypothetical protein
VASDGDVIGESAGGGGGEDERAEEEFAVHGFLLSFRVEG